MAEESQIRKEFIDYDARREPRTKRFCVRCQKDLDSGKLVRRVYVTGDMEAIHPDDFGRYLPSDGDFGWLSATTVLAFSAWNGPSQRMPRDHK